MKRIGLIYFYKDMNGLYETINDDQCTTLRSVLKNYGISSMQYLADTLPSLPELCDDISSMGATDFIFWVNSNNVKLVESVVNLLEEEEEYNYLFIGEDNPDIKFEHELITKDIDINVLKKLDIKHEFKEEFMCTNTPYRDKLLLMKDVPVVGVAIGDYTKGHLRYRMLEDIKCDMDEINENSTNICIPLCGIHIDEYYDLKSLISVLKEYCDKFTYNVTVNLKDLSRMEEELSELTVLYTVTMLDLDDVKKFINRNEYSSISGIIIGKCILSKCLEDKEQLEDICNANDINFVVKEDENSHQLLFVRSQETQGDLDEQSLAYNTFSEGVVVSRTSGYGTVRLDGATKHVLVTKEQMTFDVLEKLKDFMAINSAIHVYEEGMARSQEEIAATYETYVSTMDKANLGYANLVQIKPDCEVQVNNIQKKKNKRIELIHYADCVCEKNKNDTDLISIVQVTTKEDVKALLVDADEFYRTKKVTHSKLRNRRLQNACRFLPANKCSLTKLPRFKLGESGEIYPCIDAEISVGNIDDDSFVVSQNTYVHRENHIRNSKCSSCKYDRYCAKCSMLPKDLEDEYCDLIKKEYVGDFVLVSSILDYIMSINNLFQDVSIDEITISNEYMCSYIEDIESNNNEDRYFLKAVFIISVDNRNIHAIYCPVTGKLFRISKEITIVAECILKRLSVEDTIKALSEKADVSCEVARNICEQTYRILLSNSMLYRPINMD